MNVAVVVTGALRGRGSATLFASRVRGLSALGHSVAVYAPPGDDGGAADMIPIRRLSVRDALLELLPGAQRDFLAHDAYLALVDAWDPLFDALRLIDGRPLVVEYAGPVAAGRGAPDGEREARARLLAWRGTLASAGRVIVPDEAVRQGLLEVGICAPQVVLGAAPGAARPAREETGPRFRDAPLLLTVGRPSPAKRLEVLIEALARIARVHRGARLAVVGPLDDPEALAARDDALGLARALGVLERVTFTGFLEDTDRAQLTARAHAVVFAGGGRRGLAVAEALANGRPVVADLGSPARRHAPDAAEWVDGSSAAELSSAVLTLLGDPARAASLAARAHAAAAAFRDEAGAWMVAEAFATSIPEAIRDPGSLLPLLPLLDLVAAERIEYTESSRWPILGPAMSWLRLKLVRHLSKYFVRRLDDNFGACAFELTRELRTTRRDVQLLRARADARPTGSPTAPDRSRDPLEPAREA